MAMLSDCRRARMACALLRLILAVSLLTIARPSVAADLGSFSILDPGGTVPEVALNDVLKLKVDGDVSVEPKKAKLRINDNLLGVDPIWLADLRELHFPLKRTEGTDNNRAMWSALLGSPLDARKTPQSASLIYADKPLAYTAAPKTNESPKPEITIVKFNHGLMALALFVAAIVVLVVSYLGATTPILRDAGLVPQIPPMQRPFSLGRCQMAVWFCLILGSFLFIFVILWDLNSINAESFSSTPARVKRVIDASPPSDSVMAGRARWRSASQNTSILQASSPSIR
jgi:hypothetical protein